MFLFQAANFSFQHRKFATDKHTVHRDNTSRDILCKRKRVCRRSKFPCLQSTGWFHHSHLFHLVAHMKSVPVINYSASTLVQDHSFDGADLDAGKTKKTSENAQKFF